ncbi:MAG: SDR family NAD(P)-dependent oxidoreductase, partial [Actinomycetota bacterium]
VVLAAGIVAFGSAVETDDITIEELFLTNSMAPLWIAHRVHDPLAAQQGFFVNVSGMIADTPMPGMSGYAASKAAAAAGLAAVRKEWRRDKIDVLDARPPHTETGLASRAVAGDAPTMPEGLDPQVVGDRIVAGIHARESELAPDAFG